MACWPSSLQKWPTAVVVVLPIRRTFAVSRGAHGSHLDGHQPLDGILDERRPETVSSLAAITRARSIMVSVVVLAFVAVDPNDRRRRSSAMAARSAARRATPIDSPRCRCRDHPLGPLPAILGHGRPGVVAATQPASGSIGRSGHDGADHPRPRFDEQPASVIAQARAGVGLCDQSDGMPATASRIRAR